MRNYRGRTTSFTLYITTPSVTLVFYTVETNTSVISNGTVTSMSPAQVNLPVSLVTNDNSYSSRLNGIRVLSTEGSIFVLVVNRQSNTYGEYSAYPFQDLQLTQYQYYAVSTGTLASISDNSLSEFLLIGTKDNTTVTVVLTQTVTVPQDIQSSSSGTKTVTAGSPFTFTIHRMQTFLIGAPLLDISGSSIVSNKPLTVISGHECGNVPLVCCCQHLTEQIPPTVTWGTQFLLTPYATRSASYYKIVASESQTKLAFTCTTTNQEVRKNVTYLQNAGDFITQNSIRGYCYISSDKSVLVIQLGPSQDSDNSLGDAIISMIPSLEQHQASIIIMIPYFSAIVSTYLNIAVASKGPVCINNQSIAVTWSNIYDSNNATVGYGTQIRLNRTNTLKSYAITMESPFAALVYGFGNHIGYSYSAGVNLHQLVKSRCI